MLHAVLHAFFHSGDVLTGYRAAEDLVYELKTASRRQGFHIDHNVAVLAVAAGLFLMFALYMGFAADGLTVFNLRRTQVGFHAEFPFHALHDDFDVLVAHTAYQHFLGYRVAAHNDGGVFVHEAAQGIGNLVFFPFLLGENSPGIHGQRESDRSKQNRVGLVAEGIAGYRKL